MRLYYNIDRNMLVDSPTQQSNFTQFQAKFRDTLSITLTFIDNAGYPQDIGSSPQIKSGFRESDDVNKHVLGETDTFAQNGFDYEFDLPFASPELANAIDGAQSLNCYFEVTYTMDGTNWATSQNVNLTIYHDIV